MDKLTTISATLFMAADVFAIISLAMPDWIVTDEGGNVVGTIEIRKRINLFKKMFISKL